MMPTIRQPSTVDNLLSLPRRLRRSRPRRRGRLCNSGSTEHAQAPRARGGSIPDVWNRALGGGGGGGWSSREDSLQPARRRPNLAIVGILPAPVGVLDVEITVDLAEAVRPGPHRLRQSMLSPTAVLIALEDVSEEGVTDPLKLLGQEDERALADLAPHLLSPTLPVLSLAFAHVAPHALFAVQFVRLLVGRALVALAVFARLLAVLLSLAGGVAVLVGCLAMRFEGLAPGGYDPHHTVRVRRDDGRPRLQALILARFLVATVTPAHERGEPAAAKVSKAGALGAEPREQLLLVGFPALLQEVHQDLLTRLRQPVEILTVHHNPAAILAAPGVDAFRGAQLGNRTRRGARRVDTPVQIGIPIGIRVSLCVFATLCVLFVLSAVVLWRYPRFSTLSTLCAPPKRSC